MSFDYNKCVTNPEMQECVIASTNTGLPVPVIVTLTVITIIALILWIKE